MAMSLGAGRVFGNHSRLSIRVISRSKIDDFASAHMLEAHNLAAQRGSVRLFGGLSFRLTAGQALLVTGANGTGKTTLLRILAGLSTPESGEIRLNGTTVAPFDAELRTCTAFAGHHPALKDELTAEENLVALMTLAGENISHDAI